VKRRATTADVPAWARTPQAAHWLTVEELAGDVVHRRMQAIHRFSDALWLLDLPRDLLRWPAFPDFSSANLSCGAPYDETVPPPPAELVDRVRSESPDHPSRDTLVPGLRPAGTTTSGGAQ
jgi:hypothetical protein